MHAASTHATAWTATTTTTSGSTIDLLHGTTHDEKPLTIANNEPLRPFRGDKADCKPAAVRENVEIIDITADDDDDDVNTTATAATTAATTATATTNQQQLLYSDIGKLKHNNSKCGECNVPPPDHGNNSETTDYCTATAAAAETLGWSRATPAAMGNPFEDATGRGASPPSAAAAAAARLNLIKRQRREDNDGLPSFTKQHPLDAAVAAAPTARGGSSSSSSSTPHHPHGSSNMRSHGTFQTTNGMHAESLLPHSVTPSAPTAAAAAAVGLAAEAANNTHPPPTTRAQQQPANKRRRSSASTAAATAAAHLAGMTSTATTESVIHYVAPATLQQPSNSNKNDSTLYHRVRQGTHSVLSQECAICLDSLMRSCDHGRVVRLFGCGHYFHSRCIDGALDRSSCCPSCRQRVDAKNPPQGKMPSGSMTIARSGRMFCSGYDEGSDGGAGGGTIIVLYHIPSDLQKAYHPNPGVRHSSTFRKAYIPDTAEGRALLERLKWAFLHGLTFAVGPSLTTTTTTTAAGAENSVTWAIHHKTSPSGGVQRHGFPDSNFFMNCNKELDSLGVPRSLKNWQVERTLV